MLIGLILLVCGWFCWRAQRRWHHLPTAVAVGTPTGWASFSLSSSDLLVGRCCSGWRPAPMLCDDVGPRPNCKAESRQGCELEAGSKPRGLRPTPVRLAAEAHPLNRSLKHARRLSIVTLLGVRNGGETQPAYFCAHTKLRLMPLFALVKINSICLN
jgi:hypothetical protein